MPELEARVHEDGHTTYYVDGVWCWSITAAMKASGLTKSMDGIPEFYRDRGKAVARAIELHEMGDLDPESVDPVHVLPRLNQWRRFVDREVAHVLGVELVCWGYADGAKQIPFVAILDALVKMRDGSHRVIDAKCGKDRGTYRLQTAAQCVALTSLTDRVPEQRGVLELGEREYRWMPHLRNDDFPDLSRMFLALGPRDEWKGAA